MLKQFALVIGIILGLLGLLGLLGFFMAGDVLGFTVNTLLNIVSLLAGLWLLFASFGGKADMLKLAAQVVGVVFLVIAILGLLGVGFIVDWFNLNTADEILFLIVGLILGYFGFIEKK